MRGRTARRQEVDRYRRWLKSHHPGHRTLRCVYRHEVRRWLRDPFSRRDTHYDFYGRPLDLYNGYARKDHHYERWMECQRVKDAQQWPARIGDTTIGPYRVSTVWIGLDASLGPLPLIYETMVFRMDDKEDDPLDTHRVQAPTIADAKWAHDKVVRWVERRLR